MAAQYSCPTKLILTLTAVFTAMWSEVSAGLTLGALSGWN